MPGRANPVKGRPDFDIGRMIYFIVRVFGAILMYSFSQMSLIASKIN